VREFYKNMKIAFFSPDGPVLETIVRDQYIKNYPDLINGVTKIPLVSFSRIPFPDSVDPPTWEDKQMCFDPRKTILEWSNNMKSILMGWLQSHHKLLARIMLQNLWPLSYNNNLTLRRARFLYAIIRRIPFCMCKHIVWTMIKMQEDSSVALPYGCLITRICQNFIDIISSSKPFVTPNGAFSKKIFIKSDAQLHKHLDDPTPPPPPVQPEQSVASSSKAALPSDAIMSALDQSFSTLIPWILFGVHSTNCWKIRWTRLTSTSYGAVSTWNMKKRKTK
jgi:hypothetical protein